jgi:single-stranded DNA-binding protein
MRLQVTGVAKGEISEKGYVYPEIHDTPKGPKTWVEMYCFGALHIGDAKKDFVYDDTFKVSLIGNLTRDPEYSEKAKAYNFSVAANGKDPVTGEKVCTFWKVGAFRNWVTIIAGGDEGTGLHKGSKVYVELTPSVSKETGGWNIWGADNDKSSFEGSLTNMRFLDKRTNGNVPEDQSDKSSNLNDDEIPF